MEVKAQPHDIGAEHVEFDKLIGSDTQSPIVLHNTIAVQKSHFARAVVESKVVIDVNRQLAKFRSTGANKGEPSNLLSDVTERDVFQGRRGEEMYH